MSEFVKVGVKSDFKDLRGKAIKVHDTTVAVIRIADRIYAIQDACPHMGASLADSVVGRGQVLCSWHGWAYDLETGACDMARANCAKIYPVKIEGEDVLVGPAPEEEKAPEPEPEPLIQWDPDKFLKKKSEPSEES